MSATKYALLLSIARDDRPSRSRLLWLCGQAYAQGVCICEMAIAFDLTPVEIRDVMSMGD